MCETQALPHTQKPSDSWGKLEDLGGREKWLPCSVVQRWQETGRGGRDRRITNLVETLSLREKKKSLAEPICLAHEALEVHAQP